MQIPLTSPSPDEIESKLFSLNSVVPAIVFY
jgi:ABC-type cobalt transport system substrate-binding protein